MALTAKTTPQDTRAAQFIATHREAGFSPSETAFMAEQHAMFDRGTLRGSRMGPVMLMDFVEIASGRIASKLAQIKTTADLTKYRQQWINLWLGENEEEDGKGSVKLFEIIYKPSLVSQMNTWMDLSNPLNEISSWESAQSFVCKKLIRGEVERVEGITPIPLRQAMKQVGLHTLTWSKWLYPTSQDQAVLGGALVAFNEGLQAQTGLPGPLLGLGGGVRLHMDDDTVVDHDGVFSNSIKIGGRGVGKNAFGSTQIRLPSNSGFIALAHEWFHAFDCMMGDVHGHKMSSQIQDSAATAAIACLEVMIPHQEGEVDATMPLMVDLMKQSQRILSTKPDELFRQFDQQVAVGEPEGGWGQWAIAQNASGDHHHDATRSLGVIGSHATGSLKGRVSRAWLSLYPNAYQEKPEEQLAYAFERSCLHTGHLPSLASNPIWFVRSCIKSELAHTHQTLCEFFGSAEIQLKWSALTSNPETSPLLDSIAARRLIQRRSGAVSKVPAIPSHG